MLEEVKKAKNEVFWEGEHLIVNTRSGNSYKLEEQIGEVIDKAIKTSTVRRENRGVVTKTLKENSMFSTLIVKSCVEPVLKENEFDISKLKGSETILLKKAIAKLYDISNFLN